ncbi:hypothetical protein DVK85_07370 [Flavobacterium arcticum]|uniref:Uncharacterized protein n=1 Tax=Flavobacterium arcticum TaxID=1784713 RepID=A0A345HBW2_9FLAO|nr:hypothetical protein [Flavobacterium arcticum]AXG74072.1 hypothetical protein DVK85_07370 [Flavobacterium arcticum]KAF2507284.1 hypothetical protein E0W72_12520 [Flavobacterium arcticum]
MKKAELILVAIAIIAIGLKISHVPGGAVLGILSMGLLSMLYITLSFLLFKAKGTLQTLFSVATGFTFSILTIGILFMLMFWPGASFMTLIGSISVSIVIIISLIKYSSSKLPFYKSILLRSVILCLICATIFMIKDNWYIENQYGDIPEYIEAYKKAQADPDNEELRREANAILDSVYEEKYKYSRK